VKSRLPHFLDNRLTDCGEIVSLTRRRAFIPGRFLVLISFRGRVDSEAIVRLEGLDQLKNPMTLLEIELATFQFIAQYLDRLLYQVPRYFYGFAKTVTQLLVILSPR
jgi:hypothetical protein